MTSRTRSRLVLFGILCSFVDALWNHVPLVPNHNGWGPWGRTATTPSRRYAEESTTKSTSSSTEPMRSDDRKRRLLELISETPSNMPTSKRLTNEILDAVRQLEETCPTSDDKVVEQLAGNWELLWTAQDQTSDEWGLLGPVRTWIKYVDGTLCVVGGATVVRVV
jgi:hypothetical protein